MMAKEKLWLWLHVTKKFAHTPPWLFFPLGWIGFICCSYALEIPNGAVALGFQKDFRCIETGV